MSSIITVLISGFFGLLVAIVTWKLANSREKRNFKHQQIREEIKEYEQMYISVISSIDKTIRIIESRESIDRQIDELSLVSALTNLKGNNVINKKLSEVSDLIFIWSSEYRKGMPKKFGETGLNIVSNMDRKHIKKAEELYPKLMSAINELIKLMKSDLVKMKKDLIY